MTLVLLASGHDTFSPRRDDCTAVRPSVSLCLVLVPLSNARSVRNKAIELHNFSLVHDLDLFFLTETWLCYDMLSPYPFYERNSTWLLLLSF